MAGKGAPDHDAVEALLLMERALEILDRKDPAGNVSPHLDLAIALLREQLGLALPRPLH